MNSQLKKTKEWDNIDKYNPSRNQIDLCILFVHWTLNFLVSDTPMNVFDASRIQVTYFMVDLMDMYPTQVHLFIKVLSYICYHV